MNTTFRKSIWIIKVPNIISMIYIRTGSHYTKIAIYPSIVTCLDNCNFRVIVKRPFLLGILILPKCIHILSCHIGPPRHYEVSVEWMNLLVMTMTFCDYNIHRSYYPVAYWQLRLWPHMLVTCVQQSDCHEVTRLARVTHGNCNTMRSHAVTMATRLI